MIKKRKKKKPKAPNRLHAFIAAAGQVAKVILDLNK